MAGKVCHDIKGAFRHDGVNIGWYPMRAIAPCQIRSQPGPGAGELVGTMGIGNTCGRQSVRNPRFKPNPPRRPSVKRGGKAYVWVYSRQGSKTGWAPVNALIELPLGVDTRKPLNGPAGEDFEVGHPKGMGTAGTGPGCGKPSQDQPVRRVKAQTAHLRFSARGTSKHYLHHSDRVRVLIANATAGFHFVQILSLADGQAASARRGMRGWIHSEALEAG